MVFHQYEFVHVPSNYLWRRTSCDTGGIGILFYLIHQQLIWPSCFDCFSSTTALKCHDFGTTTYRPPTRGYPMLANSLVGLSPSCWVYYETTLQLNISFRFEMLKIYSEFGNYYEEISKKYPKLAKILTKFIHNLNLIHFGNSFDESPKNGGGGHCKSWISPRGRQAIG